MKLTPSVQGLVMPENLAVNAMIKAHRERLKQGLESFDYAHFALGQSPFPVPQPIAHALQAAAFDNAYGSAIGSHALAQAIVAFNRHHFNLDLDSDQVVISNGTKLLIYMLITMLEGHFIVPIPAWVGYVPQLEFLKRPYTTVRLKAEEDYKLNLDVLEPLLKQHSPAILVLNNPHNPTGALYTAEELKAIAAVCERTQAIILADEIYGLVTYDQSQFHSMAEFYPQRTFVTQGLSKDRSAAGYRLGVCVLPKENTALLKERFTALASTLYTNVATPIQTAAITAYQTTPQMQTFIDQTRKVHQAVAGYVTDTLQTMGLPCSIPEGSFYVVIDFNRFKSSLRTYHFDTAHALTHSLLEAPYHIALVMGAALGCAEDDLLARLAFVDYDGQAVFDALNKNENTSIPLDESFIKRYMPRVVEGLVRLESWVKRYLS